ncbi:MAG: hypothetical protein WCK16_00465 [Candidatus Moraniibacteriota bacterium]
MSHPKHLYITGFVTGTISGLLSSLTAFSMIVFISDGNSVASLSIITTVVGALVGLFVAFVIHKTSKA